ncbi:MAG TPA: ABC transporter permease [Planctomycetota bacterium]|nr:ABC transporter permease [Planctomycetota bacterium]
MSARAWLARLSPLIGLAGVFLFFLIAVWSRTGRNIFATPGNLQTIALQSAIVGMAALGMTMIILSGGIDLSIGSTVALTSVVAACLMKLRGWPAFPAACGAILAGGLCGLLNGVLVTRLQVVPFIITLGTLLILRGAAKGLADEQTVIPAASALDSLLDVGSVLPSGVWMLAMLAVGVALVLRHTRFGLHLHAVGSNEAAARLCGVPITRTKIQVYTIGGVFGGLAGLLQYSRLAMGDPTAAPGLELDVITAVVIGGGSLAGGEGSVLGSLVGALFMTTIRNGCSQMGWPNYRTEIVAGVIIILAVAVDRWRHRRGL